MVAAGEVFGGEGGVESGFDVCPLTGFVVGGVVDAAGFAGGGFVTAFPAAGYLPFGFASGWETGGFLGSPSPLVF